MTPQSTNRNPGATVCDYCGCRNQPPIGELMDEHDRIMELAWRVTRNVDSSTPAAVATRCELVDLLRMHATKEEQALYPLLIATGDLEADERADYEREHRELLALVESSTFDQTGSNTLAAHIEAEELELFPETMYAFDTAEWAEMDRVHHEVFHAFGVAHDHGHADVADGAAPSAT